MAFSDIRNQLKADIDNEKNFLHLTPNENILSKSAKEFLQSSLSERYHLGPPYDTEDFTLFFDLTSLAKKGVIDLVNVTEEKVNRMMGSKRVLLAPLSGLHSMMISLLTTTDTGDIVYSLDHNHGGHFVTAGIVKSTGRTSRYFPFDDSARNIDYDRFADEVKKLKDKKFIVYLDVSYSLTPFDIKRIRSVIGDNLLVYDASHTLGLMMGGQFPNPLEHGADMVTANTHKTLPGSHKGMIICKDEKLFEQIDLRAHDFYSSVHIDHLISLCITIHEMHEFGQDYAKKVVENANLLGEKLNKKGLTIRRADPSCWTYTHQLHVMTHEFGEVSEVAKNFYDNNIAVAFDSVYGEGHFIRFGLQEFTRRGANDQIVDELSEIISGVISGEDKQSDVKELLSKLQKVHYSYDTDS